MTTITVSNLHEADSKLIEMGINPDETPSQYVSKGLNFKIIYYIDHEAVATIESFGSFHKKPTYTVTDCRNI